MLQNFFGQIAEKKIMFPPGIEPGTFRVLGGCDNHYTTETLYEIVVYNRT